MELLDRHLPYLEKLTMSLNISGLTPTPTPGRTRLLANLRQFTFRVPHEGQPAWLVRHLARIGSAACVFNPEITRWYDTVELPQAVGHMVRALRS
jgi:hypothetical protein